MDQPAQVLLVEDNPGDADLVREALAPVKPGYVIQHVTSISAALKELGSKALDVVLLDLGLADGVGVEVVRKVRSFAPHVPIVVLTGQEDEELEFLALRTGAQDYLPKNRLDGSLLSRTIQHALERSRLVAQIESIVMSDADATLVVGRDGQVRFANPAAERMLGRAQAELVGRPFGFPLCDGEVEVPQATEVRQAEMRTVDFVWQAQRAYLVSMRDVTDRRRAADLQARLLHAEKLVSVGQLAAGVAHEINNPAAFILANFTFMKEQLGTFQALAEKLRAAPVEGHDRRAIGGGASQGIDGLVTELREVLEESSEGIERIVRIVKDLRSFSRMDRDVAELVDMNDVVTVVCNMTSNEVRHRATLTKVLGAVPLVAGDRGKLLQVVTNLVVNAAQAIVEGAASRNSIRVSTHEEQGDVVIAVEDTGGGIAPEVQPRIFQPFFTTKPRDQGTGLGLSLSHEIVRNHGGVISFVSTPGQGTTFRVKIPVRGPMAEALERPRDSPLPQRASRRARILIIDDEPAVLGAFRRTLQDEHEVMTALGGEEGLEVLGRDGNVDVVICDLMMPDVDGVTVYRTLLERSPALAQRVVFCSGGAITPRVREFVETVPNLVLDKPVPWDRLNLAIVRLLTGRRP